MSTLEYYISANPNHKVVRMGDYNLPKVDWINRTSLNISTPTTQIELLKMKVPTIDINTNGSNGARVVEKAEVICYSATFLGLNQFFPINSTKE